MPNRKDEGHLNLTIKNIPLDQIPKIEKYLDWMLDAFDLNATYWSQTIEVKRKRKHKRTKHPEGKKNKAKIEGYLSESR